MSDKPLRIVMCTQSVLHHYSAPHIGPGSIVHYCFAEEFKRRGCSVLHLILHIKPQDAASFARALQREKDELEEPGRFEVFAHQVDSFTAPRKRFYYPLLPAELPASVRSHIADFKPDVIYGFDIWGIGMFTSMPSAPTVVLLGDLDFEVRWYNQIYAMKENIWNIRHLPMMLLRYVRSKQYFKRVLSHIDSTLVIAPSSERALRPLGIDAHYMPYAWPVTGTKADITAPSAAKPTFLFFGNFGTLGSRSALHMLLEQIYPRLLHIWGPLGFRIRFCGLRTLPPWVQEMIAEMKEVEFLGFVDDLSSVMHSCHAILAPMDVPIGNRVRILTAMSLGDLLIAHTNTALGNPTLVDGQTCYLAKTPDEFVEKMKRAVERPEEVRTIRKKAMEAYEREYSPANATHRLLTELQRVTEKAT